MLNIGTVKEVQVPIITWPQLACKEHFDSIVLNYFAISKLLLIQIKSKPYLNLLWPNGTLEMKVTFGKILG